MQEVKYNYQNIEVVFENDSEFTVINKNLFTNTDEFDALVILQADGTVVHKSAISISVPALSREKFKVPAGIKKCNDRSGKRIFNIGIVCIKGKQNMGRCRS